MYDTFYREYFKITRIEMYLIYIRLFVDTLLNRYEKWNGIDRAECTISGEERGFSRSVSTCHVCASASHVSNSRIPRRRGRTSDALNAYRFPYTTHVTSFSSIHVLFQTYNGQSTISVLPAFLDLDFQDWSGSTGKNVDFESKENSLVFCVGHRLRPRVEISNYI